MDEHAMRRCIERKRDGGELAASEWEGIVAAYMDGSVDDAQMAALCMACVWRGTSFDEAHALTRAMVESGAVIAFDPAQFAVADKHSSGGVSDIVSLAAIPLAAACGAHVAKLSGRALGHTGGTIDKLQSIPGFEVTLSPETFARQVERVGCAIAAQSDAIAPADKRIYHLRDRTASVPAIGLIAASIVSKKVAGGAHAFVFDVKTGAASFVADPLRAQELGRWLIELSRRFDRPARAFVTDMSQPLGRCIGTGIEAIEARDLLLGHGDERARELVLIVASALVAACNIDSSQARVERALRSGDGYRKMLELVNAQGGDAGAFGSMRTGASLEIAAPADGCVCEIDVVRLGHTARRLTAHDPLGGLRVAVRIGDMVRAGEPLVYAYGQDRQRAAALASAFTIRDGSAQKPPLVYAVLSD